MASENGRRKLNVHSITKREALEINRALGKPLAQLMTDPDLNDLWVIALEWLVRHRDDPSVTFDQVLDGEDYFTGRGEVMQIDLELEPPDPTGAVS